MNIMPVSYTHLDVYKRQIPNINIIMSHINKENYKRVTIFFTNDTHGRARQNKRNDEMGMALVQSLYTKNAPKNSEVLVLDVGDTIYGTNETDLNAGDPMIEILNTMNCKAMAVGNHEFDYGFDQSMQAFEKANFPILSANIYKDGKRVFKPYTILEVGNMKFGVIGLSTEETLTRTKPEYVKDLTITNSSDELKKLLPEVKAQSDFIVVLGHEHTDRLREIAKEFSDIDLIIAGDVYKRQILAIIKESIVRMKGEKKVLGLNCGINMIKKCKENIECVKNVELDENILFTFKSYYNYIFKVIARNRKRFGAFIESSNKYLVCLLYTSIHFASFFSSEIVSMIS